MHAETNLRVHDMVTTDHSQVTLTFHCISPLSPFTLHGYSHYRQYFARATGAEKVLKTIYKQLKPFRFYRAELTRG